MEGLGGLLPLLLFSGGLGGSGGSDGGGISPLLLLLLLQGGFESSSSTSSSETSTSTAAPAAFVDFLTANIGRRVKLAISTNTIWDTTSVIIARIVAVGTDYVTIDRICVNGTPILDPRRITLVLSEIRGVERLTFTDRLIELLCTLD